MLKWNQFSDCDVWLEESQRTLEAGVPRTHHRCIPQQINAVASFPDPNMRQLGDFVGAEHMESHGAKSSYVEEVQRIQVRRDHLNLHSALHVDVDDAQTCWHLSWAQGRSLLMEGGINVRNRAAPSLKWVSVKASDVSHAKQ
jgi:hypothetical protein